MLLTYSRDEKLIRAVCTVRTLLDDQRFVDRVILERKFDKTIATPAEIFHALDLYVTLHDVVVGTYTPWYWRSKAHARFVRSRPYMVELSTRRLIRYTNLDKNNASLVGSIIHELVHGADNKSPLSFGHDGDRNQHLKKQCAPNRIGAIAKQFVLDNY